MLYTLLGFLMLFLQLPDSIRVPGEYLVRNYTVEDGLPVNAVSDIVQDKEGYLYFTTYNGLVRYDGYEFVTFNSSNSDGLESNRFVGMIYSQSGTIWLINESTDLIAYRNGRFITYKKEKGVTGSVLYVEESPDGDLWIVASNGLLKYKPSEDLFELQKDALLYTEIRSIEPLNNGKVLVLNEVGLFEWDGNNSTLLLKKEDFPIRVSNLYSIKKFSDGNIWIASRGLFSLNPETLKITTYSVPENALSQTWNLHELESRIIISSSNGYFVLNKGERNIRRLPINVNPMLSRPNTVLEYNGDEVLFGNEIVLNDQKIFETEDVKMGFVDREGSIWVSSEEKGLFQLRKSNVKNITTSEKYPIENIYPIIQDQEQAIWAGSFGNGVFRIHDNDTTVYTEDNSTLGSNTVRFLYEDREGTVYAGLWGRGLWEFTDDAWKQLKFPDHLTVEAMHQDAEGTIYIGTKDESYVRTSGAFIDFATFLGISFDGIRVIRKSRDETLFLGTSGNGLGVLAPDKELHVLTEQDGLTSDFIRDIYVNTTDTLWLATEDQGLNRLILNSSKEVVSSVVINTNDGLISNSLHRIIYDKNGNFWISSNQGIIQVSEASLNAYADGSINDLPVIKYDQRDGMINQEANGGVQTAGILTKNNEIWFPNQKGITVFNLNTTLDSITGTKINPLIEHLSLPDTVLSIKNRQALTLPKGNRNFSTKFTAPNFAFPERVTFRYRLQGLQNQWMVSNQAREANFTNVQPGTYQFDVQADLPNGSVSTASLLITIPPYFYETIYFKLLMAFFAIGLGFSVYRFRIHSLREREKELQRRVKVQTQQLEQAAEEKSRFFTGITHELKTPLSLILGPLDEFLTGKKSISEVQFENYLQMMQRNGYRLKNLVDQILDVSKLNADAIKLNIHPYNIVSLTRQISGQFQSLLDQKEIALKIEAEEIPAPIYVDKEAWERIIINLLSNAIKFSPEGEPILLSIKNYGSKVEVSVKDFGQGIPAKDQQKIFDYLYQSEGEKAAEGTGVGLYLVHGLMQRMGGNVQLHSKENKGAKFVLTLKKGSNHFLKDDHISHDPVELSEDSTTEYKRTTSKGATLSEDRQSDLPRILIVEDNEDFREYLTSVLSEDYHISVAKNGKEGLSVIQNIQPDMVISDVMMPIMNGFEFVSHLRELDGFKQIPVIFLSAKDQDIDVQEGLSTGADIYLTKPIRSSTLVSQIQAVLRREKVLKQDSAFDTPDNPNEPELVTQLREIVYRQLGNPNLNVDLIADKLYMSRAKLYRSWKPVSDLSVTEFIKKIRFDEAIFLIKEKDFAIQDAAQAVGFSDPNYFSTSFKKEFGIPPSEIKQ